eukprot:7019723-Pyramimonas_sp.AAC.1
MQDSLGFACLGYVAARASSAHSITDMNGTPHSTEVELLGVLWAASYIRTTPSMGGASLHRLRQYGGGGQSFESCQAGL